MCLLERWHLWKNRANLFWSPNTGSLYEPNCNQERDMRWISILIRVDCKDINLENTYTQTPLRSDNLDHDDRQYKRVFYCQVSARVNDLWDTWPYQKHRPNRWMGGKLGPKGQAQSRLYACVFFPQTHFIGGYVDKKSDDKSWVFDILA